MKRFRGIVLVLVVLVITLALPFLAFAEETAADSIGGEIISDPDVLYVIGTLLAAIAVVVSRHVIWLRGIAQSVKPVVSWADQLGLLAGLKGREKLLAAIEAFEIEYKARTGQAPGPNELSAAVKLMEREVQATSGVAKDKLKTVFADVISSTDPASAVGNSQTPSTSS